VLLGFSALLVVVALARRPGVPRIPVEAALLVLACGAFLAFQQRILRPLADLEPVGRETAELRAEVLKLDPGLSSPLNRAWLGIDYWKVAPNLGPFMEVSTATGYGFPGGRYSALVQALAGQKFPVLVNMSEDLLRGPGPVLQSLYNVRTRIASVPGQPATSLSLERMGETLGGGWFSTGLTPVASFDELAARLRQAQGSSLAELGRRGFVLDSDPDLPAELLSGPVSPLCSASRVEAVESLPDGGGLSVSVRNGADCPMTLAMNYAPNLVAESSGARLSAYPSYGALLGIRVPAGAREVLIRAPVLRPAWVWVCQLLGALLLALGGVLLVRESAAPGSWSGSSRRSS
jgi:hypothetical protein